MALVSPGVELTVVDESAYGAPGAGTVPLLLVATRQNKTDPTGSESDGIAKYNKSAEAGNVIKVTSQRELSQYFGNHTFTTSVSTIVKGRETSEYGLMAAYSYLGQGNTAYIVRANVDLNQLDSTTVEPTAPYATGSDVTATNASKLFVYKYFRQDAVKKVQSAWSTWTFTNTKIIGGMSVENILYLMVSEGQTTKLCKIDLNNPDDDTIGFNPHIDLRKAVTGTYSSGTGLTTFTSPYGAKTGLLAVNASTGADYTATNTTGSTYTIEGNHTSLLIGIPYTSTYTMSPQYVRETTSNGVISVTSGRYQLRTISFDFENSSFFNVQVTPENRDTFHTFLNGYIIGSSGKIDIPQPSTGTIRVPIQCKNTDYTLQIVSASHLPMHITGAEIEGYYHRRSARI